jgi:methylmalonyl-CoA mutase
MSCCNTKTSEFNCQNTDIEKSVERALDTEGTVSVLEDTIDIGKLLEKLPLENVAVYFNFKFSQSISLKQLILLFNIKPLLIIMDGTTRRDELVYY